MKIVKKIPQNFLEDPSGYIYVSCIEKDKRIGLAIKCLIIKEFDAILPVEITDDESGKIFINGNAVSLGEMLFFVTNNDFDYTVMYDDIKLLGNKRQNAQCGVYVTLHDVDGAVDGGFTHVIVFPEQWSKIQPFKIDCYAKLKPNSFVSLTHGQESVRCRVVSIGDAFAICKGHLSGECCTDGNSLLYMEEFNQFDRIDVISGMYNGQSGMVVRPPDDIFINAKSQVYIVLDSGEFAIIDKKNIARK